MRSEYGGKYMQRAVTRHSFNPGLELPPRQVLISKKLDDGDESIILGVHKPSMTRISFYRLTE